MDRPHNDPHKGQCRCTPGSNANLRLRKASTDSRCIHYLSMGNAPSSFFQMNSVPRSQYTGGSVPPSRYPLGRHRKRCVSTRHCLFPCSQPLPARSPLAPQTGD